jgi:glycosyltransferase involved in cell wall biosynthesis
MDDAVRILTVHFTDVTDIGGGNRAVLCVNRELTALGHECTILTVNPGGRVNHETIEEIDIWRVPSFSYSLTQGMLSIELVWHLMRKIRENQWDIVHVHGYHSPLSFQVAATCVLRNAHYVFSPHYSPDGGHSLPFAGALFTLYRPLGASIFSNAVGVICASNHEATLCRRDFGISSGEMRVIPHGVDTVVQESRKAPAMNDEPITLVYVGCLLELKGVQFIIRALHQLLKGHSRSVRLRIVGSGKYEPRLRNMAEKLGIENSITWCGVKRGADIRKEYEAAHVFLLVSKSENFGISVAEALASGTPCIVSNHGALKEFTEEPGCYGIEYPPDPSKLASLILDVTSRETQVGPFSSRVRTWRQTAREYESFYLETTMKRRQSSI